MSTIPVVSDILPLVRTAQSGVMRAIKIVIAAHRKHRQNKARGGRHDANRDRTT
jgi:hypothetical protein